MTAAFEGWAIIAITFLLACHQKAPPMDGECVGVAPAEYDGARASGGPTLRCSWRGAIWACNEQRTPEGSRWRCINVGPAPAERGSHYEARP